MRHQSVLRPPYDVAWQFQSVFRYTQHKVVGYPDNIRYFNRRPGRRNVSDDAVDLIAAVIDFCRPGDPKTGRNASFDHNRALRRDHPEPRLNMLKIREQL